MSKSKNDIHIRGLSDKTLNELDNIMIKRGIVSRNDMICKIIEEYVACNNDEMVEFLPKIVRSLCRDEIKNTSANSSELITDVYRTMLRLIRITQKLENFLYPELDKIDANDLNSKQLLAIINAAESSDE
ncbi:hypothetical protein [Ruminococcus albus]|jgi:hypothetical protein|uniref:Uncharacterized protein n=1 Tax=Ruminococcus albus (strain ATCC 27210 / DSM 20455 / JCM 14654 / NCDO 2250 / 7) TaxID=697329 RepID=E6UGQ1_RUMA7|nr:hypothetical protein [Ruminococcus albus]ADU23713.1 hypothetical protein Rumal_3250 [Ruminococcus albus 7 = DSM 20455]